MEFCGRSNELNEIIERWRFASDINNPRPQIVVLCGEAGLGKTRLAMEFFDWLRRDEDISDRGYWPEIPSKAGENIEINPNYRECNFREHQIPFLWWGVRAGDIATENSVHGDAIGTYLRSLSPHLAAMTLPSRFIRNGFEDVLKDWGNFITSEVIGNASGIGPLMAVGEKTLKTVKILADTYHRSKFRDVVGEEDKKSDERTDAILDDLSSVLSPTSKDSARKPAVILLDDTHFYMNDSGLSGFTAKLMHRAVSERWPVMILATHWRREFIQGIGPFMDVLKHARGEQGGSRFNDLTKGYLTDDHFHVVELAPVGCLDKALKVEFPGLTAMQMSELLRSAGGNPRHLTHIAMYLRKNKGLFEDFDLEQPLTDTGLKTVKQKAVNLGELVTERLRNAPIEVQQAVCIASMIGMQFADKLVEAVAVRHIDWRSPDALSQAVDPYSMIRSVDDSQILEFSDRLFYSAAVMERRNMKSLADEEALIKTIKAVVKEQYIAVTTIEEFRPVTKSKSNAVERDYGGPSWEERQALWQYARLIEDIAAEVFAEDDDEAQIEFECLQRKLDVRKVEKDPEVWAWLSRRLLKVLENNPKIRAALSSSEIIEFSKLFRLTGFREEALELLEYKLKLYRDVSELFGYGIKDAVEASEFVAETVETLTDLGRFKEARACLQQDIEAFHDVATNPPATYQLLAALERKAMYEHRQGNLDEFLVDCRSWLATFKQKMPSLYAAHDRNGQASARPLIFGHFKARLTLHKFLSLAIDKLGDRQLVSEVCQARIEFAEFCIAHDPKRYVSASIQDCSVWQDWIENAGFKEEADQLAAFKSHVKKRFPEHPQRTDM